MQQTSPDIEQLPLIPPSPGSAEQGPQQLPKSIAALQVKHWQAHAVVSDPNRQPDVRVQMLQAVARQQASSWYTGSSQQVCQTMPHAPFAYMHRCWQLLGAGNHAMPHRIGECQ
jgi:hypothetical protein